MRRLWALMNSGPFCFALWLAFSAWVWSWLDPKHRLAVVLVIGAAGFIGAIRTILRLLGWGQEPARDIDAQWESEGLRGIGEIIPPSPQETGRRRLIE